MIHLTDEQLVDAVDGVLSPAPSAHVVHCQMCAEKVEVLRRIVYEIRRDDVPEPSPLFWNGFASRVRASIVAPVDPARLRSFPAWRWAVAAAALVIVVIGVQFAGPRSTPEQEMPFVSHGDDAADPATIDPDGDEAWTIVQSIASELHFDDARDAGVMPRAGAIERAATELSPEERAELVRILEDELKRTGA